MSSEKHQNTAAPADAEELIMTSRGEFAASIRPSDVTTSATFELPDGCSFGELLVNDAGSLEESEKIIWVEFAPGSTDNPFNFSTSRKFGITGVAVFFTFMTAYTTSAYTIGIDSMCADLGCTTLQAEAGLGLYAWGFGIFPLVLAPLSEEFGRKWTYVAAVFFYWIIHLGSALAQNTATVLVCRFLQGAAGSIGATLVGGTISDIYIPSKRGIPMALFGLCAIFGSGLGAVTMSWVEVDPRLQWRWIQWIQFIVMAAFFPLVIFIMRETRSTVILRRRAAQYRKKLGEINGARFLARSEIEKVAFVIAIRQSLIRPLMFLVSEPIVTFFSIWIALGWGVFYTQIGGLSYIFTNIYGFSTTQVSLVYICMCIGSIIGFGTNFLQEKIYRAKAPTRGVEARLYSPMIAGVCFAAGCFIYGFTSIPTIHWIVPCIGICIILASIMTIYITAFTYLSECYGSYASSAIAAQSFCRNMFAGAFSFFTTQMYETLTPRWAIFLMGCLAAVLAVVPFVAFFKGPQIRARSKFSKMLMAAEHESLEREQQGRERRGLDTSAAEDLELSESSEKV